jgi:hypothetical protein
LEVPSSALQKENERSLSISSRFAIVNPGKWVRSGFGGMQGRNSHGRNPCSFLFHRGLVADGSGSSPVEEELMFHGERRHV